MKTPDLTQSKIQTYFERKRKRRNGMGEQEIPTSGNERDGPISRWWEKETQIHYTGQTTIPYVRHKEIATAERDREMETARATSKV